MKREIVSKLTRSHFMSSRQGCCGSNEFSEVETEPLTALLLYFDTPGYVQLAGARGTHPGL